MPEKNVTNITSLSQEARLFPPAKEFSRRAHIKSLSEYRDLYMESIRSPEKFWAKQAKNELVWFKPWKYRAEMEGAEREMVRRRQTQRQFQLPRQVAQHADGEQGRAHLGRRTGDAMASPAKSACSLTSNCIAKSAALPMCSSATAFSKGDRIIIYLPMVPEAAIAMLACTRIGAVHSVVFGGFSAQSVADRIFDCQAKMVITCRWRISPRRGRSAEEKCR